MAISYKKLWKLLIDKDMRKKDLSVVALVCQATASYERILLPSDDFWLIYE